MAEDVSVLPAEEQPLVDNRSRRARRRDRARGSSYKLRFGLLYVALAMVLGVAVGAFVVLALDPDPEPDPEWSAWKPSGSQTAMLRQIADRIPQAYRQNGKQLTVSTAQPLSITTEQGEVPINTVFVLPDTSRGLAEEDDIDRYDGGSVASFALCGVGGGEACSMAGKPSPARLTLIGRQALELSLYTLKYVDGIDSVMVFMPPAPDGQPTGTVFLTRDDVRSELRRPLTEVLPTAVPTVGNLSEVEEGHVLRLVEPRTYAYEVQPAPDGSLLLALSPPEPQTP